MESRAGSGQRRSDMYHTTTRPSVSSRSTRLKSLLAYPLRSLGSTTVKA